MEQAKKDIGALWEKTSKRGVYLSGMVNGQRVVMFRNDRKQAGERTPDWRVYPHMPTSTETPRDGSPVGEIHQALTDAVRQSSHLNSDDIPF